MFILPSGFVSGYSAPESGAKPAWWFAFAGNRLLVEWRNGKACLPFADHWPLPELTLLRQLYLGALDQHPCYGVEIPENADLPRNTALQGLRELWGVLDETLFGLSGQALQIVDWDRCHQYCGRCGASTQSRGNDRAKHCAACGLLSYPRIAPAIMVRVVRNESILLARSPHYPPGRYSVLAGFVEPGETLEQTAHREVMEEVGIQIANLRYFGSQSWPFPHSLMIAFEADYAGGEIRIDAQEIEEADWFTRDRLPELPPPISIARWMIDDYLGSRRH